jgi:Fic family protein
MNWNWQRPDWPKFSWRQSRLRRAEERFLLEAGTLAGALKHISPSDRQQVAIQAIGTEAVTTSEIEGETLDRASVQSSIRRQLGLATDRGKIGRAEEGISRMMVDFYRTFARPLSNAMLFSWHRLIFEGRGMADIGRYRTGAEPMEIVSGPVGKRRVHFEAPPTSRAAKEMTRFIDWFNRGAPAGADPLPALTRAGIAHLYFESIHPFEDGNGRIGRSIAEKALAQAFGQPPLTALAATILLRRKAYYEALAAASKSNEITAWLAWFAGIVIEAQRRAAAQVEFILDKSRLLDRLRGQLNPRQEKVLLRMLREGPEGFKGGLSAGNYATITEASPATTTRDLAGLVDQGALTREGELRYARYRLAIPLRTVSPVKIDARGNLN